MATELDRMSYDEVEQFLENGSGIVLLPLGSTEEHGPHGPLGVDTFTATLMCQRVAEKLDAVVAPSIPYGMALDQTHYKGTVSLRPRTLSLLIKEVCENFSRDGYRLILIISGHRGNDNAAIAGLQEVSYESATHMLYMCYQDANRGRLKEIISPEVASHIHPADLNYGADGHGGSFELSIAEVFAPGSVKMDKLQKPDRGPADTLRSFPFRSALNMEEYAPTDGFFGDPSICSMELGETITEHTSTVIAEEVRRYLKAFPKRWRKEN